MSATLYLIARAYPALLIVPALNIPLVNGIVFRIGTNIIEGLCVRLPVYVFKRAASAWRQTLTTKDDEKGTCIIFEVKTDPDFPEFESIEFC